MDLKKQSEKISCNSITFLNNEYDIYNANLFKKQMIPNSKNEFRLNEINQNKYLKSSFITKKDCIYESTEPDMGEWETQFDLINNNNDNNKSFFNINTKAKLNQDVICP